MSEIIVKALDWDGDEYVGWTAYGVGLGYSIDDESGEEECFILTKHDGSSELRSAHASLGAAQDYAQADYAARILSAIDLEAHKALIAERDAEIERLREVNRKLHRRVQLAEAFMQCAPDYLTGWLNVLTPRGRKHERLLVLWIIRDIQRRTQKLSSRYAALNASDREGA